MSVSMTEVCTRFVVSAGEKTTPPKLSPNWEHIGLHLQYTFIYQANIKDTRKELLKFVEN